MSEAMTNPSKNQVHAILEAIQGIRYGSVEVVIHDSKIVQVEKKEKIRFEKSGEKNLPSGTPEAV